MERNLINPEFCPVVALLTWLKVTGITSGPLFPALERNHRCHVDGAAYLADTYQAHVRLVFDYVGGAVEGCSSHSFRKSAVAWGARCGVPERIMINIGRWANDSKAFQDYVRFGLETADRMLGIDKHLTDPVFGFWCFRTQAPGGVQATS